jgi:2-polyprenyl-3-methyl-5-hydroxy-6-metoxy-1,4-benzoquinol methylase
MRQIIKDYLPITDILSSHHLAIGDSASPKDLIFHVFNDNSQLINVLDIGFGTGRLGHRIKNNPTTSHWQIDGVDGWEANCQNSSLFEQKIYRNIWHGLGQDINPVELKKYEIICLLDVIEHLDAETAKWLLRTLLTYLADNAYLFISTPLWFYPQDQQQDGDLEEHKIGVPASSMLALVPKKMAINHPLVGGFIYGKESLQYIDFFQPTSNKNFSYAMGLKIMQSLNIPSTPGVVVTIS